ncbi:M13-type metalloendopeptidase, partial [Salmonella sp. s54925]|uniref:M13-type metalloendopeptidase n=1 Tax=Salmonella sp. s54925 TaxID=3159674 RepID=UPI003980E027
GNEDRLPGLSYTNDQLFFVGFAQTWCAKYREENIDSTMKKDTHAINPVRVRVPLSNFPAFSKAFGCKAPTNTCTVW